ncbi:MAG: AAA family ATPase [Dehalococcoidia bacterium]|nr:AAA family ATPase [Dehalococcoidia bacterium]
MKVIGVVGDIGSGKDEVLKYLRNRYGVPYISTGDMVRQIAREEGLEGTRENLSAISKRCFTEMGRGCFVRMAGQEIQKRGWKVAGISGVRSPDDVAVMKEMFGDGFILVRVDIKDPAIRFERVRLRGERRDPPTLAAFQEQDRNEEQEFQINKAEAMADYKIDNSGTLEELRRRIDDLVASKKLPIV